MGKRVRKEIVIGSSGVVIIVTIVVIGLVLILNKSVKQESTTILPNATNQTKEIFYRLENNQCNSISLIVPEKTLNDYSTFSECQSKIIITPPVKRVPIVGDFYKFDELKLGENLSKVKTYLDKNDMPNFLMDFSLEDNVGNDHDYTQKISLEGNAMNFTVFRDPNYKYLMNLTELTDVFGFKIEPNLFIFNYTLDFSEPISWEKLVGSEIYLFAQKFTIKKVSDSPLSITLESEKGNRIDLISSYGVEINYNPYNGLYDLKPYIMKDNGYLTKLVIEWKTDDRYFFTSDKDFILPFFDVMKFTLDDINYSANKSYATVFLRTQEPVEEEYVVPVVNPPIGGDRFLFGLNIGKGLQDVYRGTITGSNTPGAGMPHLLKNLFVLANENHPYGYEQKIIQGNLTLSDFRDSDYEELVGITTPTNVTGFRILPPKFILNYTISFFQLPPTEDLKNSNIYILGKEFSIDNIDASNLSMNLTDSIGNKLYLKDNQDIVLNGEHIPSLRSFIQIHHYYPYYFADPNYSVDTVEKIVIQWKADEESFVTEQVELPIPYFNTLKFVFEGMNSVPDSNGQLYGNMTLVSQ